MYTILLIILIASGFAFTIVVALINPKGGLSILGGGSSSNHEYGSQKSLESGLKTVAYISGSLFVIAAIILPLIA